MLRLQKNIENNTNHIVIPKIVRQNWGNRYDVLDCDGHILIKPGDTKNIVKGSKLFIQKELVNKYGKSVYMEIYKDHIILKPTSKGE